ncbi:uncharacterized protein KIAA0754-like [Simochromis diagramma]|uniref:uncharacterized protein KIAA0754-like n=1 Tax=Simochromis diagramma TaxID=43689 RepID=UPI001A7E36B3|nr:uncharacterized protein KIAA0754-like [Simochromis diagramma]
MIPPTTMDPANSGVAMEERSLAQLWDYCRSVVQAVNPHRRHIQVVFLDNHLTSTTFTTNILDINKLRHLVARLRESSSFELFGLGGPSMDSSAALLETVAAWFFTRRRRVFPSMLAAQSFDPPLRKACRTLYHHPITPQPTPAVSARSAGNGPTALITAVSKPDSFVSINHVIENHNPDEQQKTVSIHPAPPSRRRRRPHKQRSTTSTLTPVLVEDSGPAALDATVSKMDSAGVINPLPENIKIETVCCTSKDSANIPSTTVSWELGGSEHTDPNDFLAQSGRMETEVLPRASPETELEVPVASGPLVFVGPAVTFSSSPPFIVAISPSPQPAAQLVAQSSVQSASHLHPQLEVDMPAGPLLPSFHPSVPASLSSLPGVAATPSSPPDHPSVAEAQPSTHPPAVAPQLSSSPAATSPPAPALPEREPGEPEELALPEQKPGEPEELALPEQEPGEPEEPALPEQEEPGEPEEPALPEQEPGEPEELALLAEEELSERDDRRVMDLVPRLAVVHRSSDVATGPVAGHQNRFAATGPLAGRRRSSAAAATGPVAGHQNRSAATGPVAGRRRSSAAATGPVAGPLNCFAAAAGPGAVRRSCYVAAVGLEVGPLNSLVVLMGRL